MGTLQAPSSPEVRKSVGDDVISASGSVDTKPVRSRFDAFKKIHATYSASQKKVDSAQSALRIRQALNGELDAALDDAVEALATALSGDGLPRQNPFKPFGNFLPPSKLCELGYGEEAKQVRALVKKVLARKGLSAKSVSAAKKADAAAMAVEAALAKVEPIQNSYDSSLRARDALVPAWEAAFAKLKRGVRAAEDDGAEGLFEALFKTTAKPKKKEKPAPTPT